MKKTTCLSKSADKKKDKMMSRVPRTAALSSLLSVLFLLVLYGPIDGNAQPSNLNIGDRVRITAPSPNGKRLVGTVVDYSSSVIVVKTDRSKFSIPITSVNKFEISRGKKSHTGMGMALGSFLGGIAGAIIADSKEEDSVCNTDQGLCGLNFEWLGGIAYGTGFGLLGGAILGSMIKTDRWVEKPLDLTVGIYRSKSFPDGVNPAIRLTIPLNRKKPH